MENKKIEGLLLYANTYLGKQKILKVFTKEMGLITLFAKKNSLGPLYSPFLKGEWVFTSKNTEFFSLQDGTLLEDFFNLRQNYAALISAGKIAQRLLQSQLLGKPAPLLYALTEKYFQKLQTSQKPENLACSFDVKLLFHEGLFHLQNTCSFCHKKALYLRDGESVCKEHSSTSSLFFQNDEWEKLQVLTLSRSFKEIEEIPISETLKEKIGSILDLYQSQ